MKQADLEDYPGVSRAEKVIRLLIGDARECLAALPVESVHCVVTSPPYWGLRAYGTDPAVWGGDPDCTHEWGDQLPGHHPGQVEQTKYKKNAEAAGKAGNEAAGQFCLRCNAWRGELGLEPTPDLYLAHMVAIFRDVRRVLRRDGTLWLNLGDCWAGGVNGRSAADNKKAGDDRTFRDKPFSTAARAGRYKGQDGADFDGPHRLRQIELKPKDLVGMPWRVALALQADGWWLRSDIVWHKPNPMPSSVRDRLTPAHEYLFLLAKAPRYFFDREAIKEPIAASSKARYAQPTIDTQKGGAKQDAYEAGFLAGGSRARSRRPNEIIKMLAANGGQSTRARRDVWTIPTQPFREAHFATFPERLVEPCLEAGTSERGVCPACGAPWRRIVERRGGDGGAWHDRENNRERGHRCKNPDVYKHLPVPVTAGFAQGCECPPARPMAATVLDPFGGSGTVGVVAARIGRRAILIEKKPDYAALACRRLSGAVSPFQIESDLARHGHDEKSLATRPIPSRSRKAAEAVPREPARRDARLSCGRAGGGHPRERGEARGASADAGDP